MNRFLAIVLLAFVAVQAVSASYQVEFMKLNKYLNETLPGDDNKESNLNAVRQNLDSFEPAVKKAAELVLDLAGNTHTQCDANLLALLTEVDRVWLSMEYTPGYERLLTLMKDSWAEATATCAEFVHESYSGADESMGKFLSIFQKPSGLESGTLRPEQVAAFLQALADGDPQAQFYKFDEETKKHVNTRDEAIFNYALNEHLLKPCQRVMSPDELPNNLLALTLADSHVEIPNKGFKKYKTFVGKEPARLSPYHVTLRLTSIDWTKRACEAVVKMDDSTKAKVMSAIYDRYGDKF